MKVSELIEQLQVLPQDKSVLCQVVGQDSGVWNMEFELNNIKDSWMVHLKVEHRKLNTLPMDWN